MRASHLPSLTNAGTFSDSPHAARFFCGNLDNNLKVPIAGAIIGPDLASAMTEPASKEVTQLLVDWSKGDREALDRLVPYVYDELHRLARHYMRRERVGHTLQTSALINEAYLRLVDQTVAWKNRAHFFGIAARLMRQILVDHARAHKYAKRGGDAEQVSLDKAANLAQSRAAELVALDEALNSLAAIDPQQARIVEMRFFGGLTIEETAEALGISHATVERDWSVARAWLTRELKKQ
jgi:RNA polymerase sigma-70 factor, ECF subfamily